MRNWRVAKLRSMQRIAYPSPIFDWLTFYALVAVVAWVPLPFGSYRPWSWSVLATAVAVLLLLWGVGAALSVAKTSVSPRRIWPAILLFLAAAAWTLVQIAASAPSTWHHPVWQEAAEILALPMTSLISVNAFDSGTATIRLLAYGGVFWLAIQFGRDRERAKQAIYAVIAISFAYAAYGLVVDLLDLRTILWYDKWAYETDLTSTFVNRNSYATYAGIGLICSVGLFAKNLLREIDIEGQRRKTAHLFIEFLTGKGRYLLIAILVVATALFLTESRAGVASSIVGLATLGLIIALTRRIPRRQLYLVLGLCVAALLVIFETTGSGFVDRIADKGIHLENRSGVYRITQNAIDDSPVLGTGYGSFPDIFTIYRDGTVAGYWYKAHNTYLENALELGIPAAVALFAAVALMGGRCLAGARYRQRDMIYPCLGVAVTVQVAVHSLLDFSLQIPAVAVTYAFVLGIGCAQSWSSKRSVG